MKNYIRSALDTLEALDFRLDHEDRKIRTDRWIFTHPNSPDECLRINIHMKEQAARTVVQRAKQIVGLAAVGTEKPAPKANQRAKAEREVMARRRAASIAAKEAREAQEEAERLVAVRRRQVGELDSLMRGKASGVGTVPAAAMLTIAEVADETGLTEKAVQRAVDSDRLTAYMCGGVVKVKGSDVRSWLGAA